MKRGSGVFLVSAKNGGALELSVREWCTFLGTSAGARFYRRMTRDPRAPRRRKKKAKRRSKK